MLRVPIMWQSLNSLLHVNLAQHAITL